MPKESQEREIFSAALAAGTNSLGLKLSPEQIEKFLSYLSLLRFWNSKLNLTSVREPTLILRRHFLDSLAIGRFLGTTQRLLDIGSGAGFPGIPLHIAFPQKEIVLVESRRKKANFLREIIRRLELKKVEVIEGRAEGLRPEEVGLFPEVVTRAFGSLELFLILSFPLLAPNGRSLVMHGPKGVELFRQIEGQWRGLGFSSAHIEKFSLPLGNEKRTLLIFVKGQLSPFRKVSGTD